MTSFVHRLQDCIDDYYTHQIKAVCIDHSLSEPSEVYDVMEKEGQIYLRIYVNGGSCWHRMTSKDSVQIRKVK